MKTIDLFRSGIKAIIEAMPDTPQKEIALKLNKAHADPKTAASDFNDFLGGRKLYGQDKQERLAQILGYSHIEILKYGETILERTGKIKNFKEEKQKKIMCKNGSNYSLATILKMAEDFLMSDDISLQIQRSYLIENIVRNWKTLMAIKKLKRKK